MAQERNTVNISNNLPRYSGDAHPLDFSYFCRFDEVTGVVACPGKKMPALRDSCFLDRDRTDAILESLKSKN